MDLVSYEDEVWCRGGLVAFLAKRHPEVIVLDIALLVPSVVFVLVVLVMRPAGPGDAAGSRRVAGTG
jgi:hypothetical protein